MKMLIICSLICNIKLYEINDFNTSSQLYKLNGKMIFTNYQINTDKNLIYDLINTPKNTLRTWTSKDGNTRIQIDRVLIIDTVLT